MLTLYHLDIDKAMEESGIDYLLVTSRAPSAVAPGEAYRYPIVVKSKKGGVNYKLESGPEGMTMSKEGELQWNVPKDAEELIHSIIVLVTDSAGQETHHTFDLHVTAP